MAWRRAISRHARASAEVAGKSRLRKQTHHRYRQRCNSHHPDTLFSRTRGARHDASALTVVHRYATHARLPREPASTLSARPCGIRALALEECAARNIFLQPRTKETECL